MADFYESKPMQWVKKAGEKENEAHPEETAYYLPETLNGETVTWSKVPDLTGLELMALAAAAGAACWAAKSKDPQHRGGGARAPALFFARRYCRPAAGAPQRRGLPGVKRRVSTSGAEVAPVVAEGQHE